jgi:hypothetical protein
LVEPAARGCEVNDRHLVHGTLRHDGLQRALERLGQHDHARPTSIRTVVDAPVVVLSKVPQWPQMHLHLPRLEGPTRDAMVAMSLEEFWKQGENVKAHGKPRSTVPSINRPSTNRP